MPNNPTDVLGVSENLTKSELKAFWLKAAHELHPDKGGDPETFKTKYTAYKTLYEKANNCNNCCDKGKIKKPSGFSTITVICRCKGGMG